MFKGFSNLKLGLKITFGFVVVLVISLISGVTMGRNITSPYVILGLIFTIALSMFIAYLVTKNITSSVSRIIKELTHAAGSLTAISKEITSNGHQLAEGTTQQASSIQETSSTLEESASMVHQTTQNTKEADALAKQTKEYANRGNVEMQTMLEAMEELKKSASDIAKIIKVIDEIAFQTNILSLNAAVEAARAGDAGKGFAVVAEEVRNLAQRSAQAAKDTAGIIEGNISLTEKCLVITDQVNTSLVAIKDETNKVSELLEEISTASQEQEIGISQINKAIAQMEAVVQANASTAQESATSADELSTYSEEMKAIVSSLVALIEGASNLQSNMNMITENVKSKGYLLGAKTPKSQKPQLGASKYSKQSYTAPSRPTSAPPVKESKVNTYTQERRTAPAPKKAELDGAKVINPEDIIPLDDF